MSLAINCEEGFVEIEKRKIYYKIYKSSKAHSTPLVLIHGGPGFTHHYLETLYGLGNERPVILYDQLGCGKSERPEDLSYCNVRYFVSELESLISHLKIDKVNLLGHSWGSTIAAEYASANKNIEHLILASPFMSSKLWMQDVARYKDALPDLLKNALISKDSELYWKAFNEYYKKHVYGTAESDRSIQLATETASKEVYNTMWGENELDITGVLKEYDCTEKIEKIKAKTLFTAGEFDTGSPRACAIMAKKIKDSKLKFFPKLAHFPHLEEKAEYITYLRDFLNDKTKKVSFLKKLFN